MRRIPIGNGYSAKVDNADYAIQSPHHWYFEHGMAVRCIYVRAKKYRLLLHRLILDVPDDLHVEFKDGDKLNCQRSNLRIVKRASTRKRGGTSSQFKGVSKHRHRWIASIRFEGVLHHLGRYDEETDAARAYDRAARKLHGAFARTNRKLGLLKLN